MNWKDKIRERLQQQTEIWEKPEQFERLANDLITDIESLLKQQRQICYEEFELTNSPNAILNAPEPEGEVKTNEEKKKESWEDELKKKLIELMFDYYEHGANMHTIIPDNDAKPILADIKSLLKEQREICAQEYIKQRDYHVARTITSDCILNAPEPTNNYSNLSTIKGAKDEVSDR